MQPVGHFSAEVIKDLCDAVAKQSKLEKLCLRTNWIGNSGVVKMAKILMAAQVVIGTC